MGGVLSGLACHSLRWKTHEVELTSLAVHCTTRQFLGQSIESAERMQPYTSPAHYLLATGNECPPPPARGAFEASLPLSVGAGLAR